MSSLSGRVVPSVVVGCVVVCAAVVSFALLAHGQALPAFKATQIQGMALNVPVGWASEASQSNGVAVIALSEQPKGATSADVLLCAVPAALGPNAHTQFKTQMLQNLMPNGAAVAHAPSPAPPAGVEHGTLSGSIGGTPARLGWLSISIPGQPASLVAFFAATPKVYEAWGGVGFLVNVLGGVPAAPAAANKPVAAAGPFKIPRRFKGYNQPVLAYLAETIKRQTPANVLQALGRLNPTEKGTLALYSAFTNQLVWYACQADPRFVLDLSSPAAGQNIKNCAENAQGWAVSQSHVATLTPQNCSQCDTEAQDIAVAFRCTAKLLSKPECDAYIQFRRGQIRSDAAVIQRIIHNLGGNNCVCGDPGCDC